MGDEFTGSNTAKIEKLVTTAVELRTTLRICFGIIGVGFPLMVSLLVFLVLQVFSLSAKMERLSDQIAAVRRDYDSVNERLLQLEARLPSK